ncbi:hypothetical protein [Paraburkholderia sp. 35.1]|uniref:hypothetical protein n=1 Tax=Paraburkholderia sp. 35.1 TaxID=2991058 RepID=UPI003D1C6AF6
MRITTAYLMTLDTQDVFDIVAWQLLRQNGQSMAHESARCRYRAPDGKRCAVGWLIPDDVYSPRLEHLGVRDVAAILCKTDHGIRFAEFLCRHMSLLRDLQGMHDARAPAEWPAALREIARGYGLRETVIGKSIAHVQRCAPPEHSPAHRLSTSAYLLDLIANVAAQTRAPATASTTEREEVA